MRGCFICGRRWQVYSDHIREVDPWR
jgi:hypothetical protein